MRGGSCCALPRLLLWLAALMPLDTVDAAWILVDDFESYDPGTVYSPVNKNEVYPVVLSFAAGAMEILPDPVVLGNQAAWFWYYEIVDSEIACGGVGAWHHIPLPKEVAMNEGATVFFRTYMSGHGSGWEAMLSKYSAAEVPECGPDWPFMAALLRFNSDLDPAQLDAFDGSHENYLGSYSRFTPDLGVWYSYWIYVDNSFDESDPDNLRQEDVGYYQAYVQGPDDITPRLLTWQSGERAVSSLRFRNTDYAPIKDFVLWESPYDSDDVWLIDDIYSTPGKDLSNPVPWCGFTNVDGYADTGGWLGWLWPGAAPWMYSMSLNSWVYVPGCSDGAGGWVYVGM